jgi:ABC-2 type transport system permease protein
MKLLPVIKKCLLEQYRQMWLLILTVSMAPFFVCIYYLMMESSSVNFHIELVNEDQGYQASNYGVDLIKMAQAFQNDSVPVYFHESADLEAATARVKNRKADAVVIIPKDFSTKLTAYRAGQDVKVPFELTGDLTDPNYIFAAVFGHEMVVQFIAFQTGTDVFYELTETPIGLGATMNEFDLYVPGLIILSTVMLMFTASIAFVRESEQNTIIRLKLSKIRNWELIGGIGIVQLVIGLISILLTLGVATLMGYNFNGSWGNFLIVTTLTSLSIAAFSLIVAAFTKTVNQVLIVGNFPLFLFMFFTGAMMPIGGLKLFQFAGYAVTLPGLMSPYHGVQALKKISLYEAGLFEVWPELLCLCVLIIIYFLIGSWLFKKRHLRLL